MSKATWLGQEMLNCCSSDGRTSLRHFDARSSAFTVIKGLRAPRSDKRSCQTHVSVPVRIEKATVGETLSQAYDKTFPDSHTGRRAGIILHPTSLPGPYGCGEIGREALRFIDWLASAGLQAWQVLPLVPPDQQYYSPYTGLDANCCNPLLIAMDGLMEDGLIRDYEPPHPQAVGDANFNEVAQWKMPLLTIAARRMLYDDPFRHLKEGMTAFRKNNPWVEDSALFECLRTDPELEGMLWWEWPEPIRFRRREALRQAREKYAQAIDEFVAIQYLFDKQWSAVKKYANERGVSIIGDMPIYVGGHSADVWANGHLFELTSSGAPAVVSGVPPDAFSTTGQLWGTPLYDWKAHRKENYRWWAQRMGRSLKLFDETRVDHFRGFAGYWVVDAEQETAIVGHWKKGPGAELFHALQNQLGAVPIIAEDLGVITPDVKDLREKIGAPGMVVLQFAWGSGSKNTHLPHMHYENSVVYPGTHDNETAVGWFYNSATSQDKEYIQEYLNTNGDDIAWVFIREAMKSVSKTCIIQLQDVMRLDNSGRMNSPGRAEGNWRWRVGESDVWDRLRGEADGLRRLMRIYNRLPKGWEQ